MKKAILLIVLVCFLALSLTACFGKFSLTRKIYSWNSGIGDSGIGGRFIRTLVFYVMNIIPVYPIGGFIDCLILNLIEFWTGSNPLAMTEGDMEIQYATVDGVDYEIVATMNRFDIREVAIPENAIAYVFSPDEAAWYLHAGDTVAKITEDTEEATRFFNLDGKELVTVFN